METRPEMSGQINPENIVLIEARVKTATEGVARAEANLAEAKTEADRIIWGNRVNLLRGELETLQQELEIASGRSPAEEELAGVN